MNNTDAAVLHNLLFDERGAMAFQDKPIPEEDLTEILGATASCSWLGKWKLVAVTKKDTILRVVETWQDGLRELGLEKDLAFVERWKRAPLIVVFCLPKVIQQFQWVPPEAVKVYATKEVGTAVRSLELAGTARGVYLHGIMGVLVPSIGTRIQEVLQIPPDYHITYFGIMGYPSEEVKQKFPDIQSFCFSDSWGISFGKK